MRIEKLDDGLLIWQTGRQNNEIEYDSRKDLSKYSRRWLSTYEDFLREEGEVLEADRIKKHLGKIIKSKNIPI